MATRRGKKREYRDLQTKLEMLKEGEHYSTDGSYVPGANALFKKADREETSTQVSKRELMGLPISQRFKREAEIDYMNPREELPKFTKFVDQIQPFDRASISLIKPTDYDSLKQVDLVMAGRAAYIQEESKYDVTIENASDKLKTFSNRKGTGQSDPPPTRAQQRELARAALMDSTSSL
jgi:hypothetical protein